MPINFAISLLSSELTEESLTTLTPLPNKYV